VGVVLVPYSREHCGIARVLNSVALTVYKIDYSTVAGKPEAQFK
jgi:hypothetical protein